MGLKIIEDHNVSKIFSYCVVIPVLGLSHFLTPSGEIPYLLTFVHAVCMLPMARAGIALAPHVLQQAGDM